MIGWTAANYISALITLVAISFGGVMVTIAIRERGYEITAAFILLGFVLAGSFGVVGLAAAPFDSPMERDYWEAKFEKETELASIQEELDEKLAEDFSGLDCNIIGMINDGTESLLNCTLRSGTPGIKE